MSRSMIETNKRVFSRLTEVAKTSGRALANTDAVRFVKTTPEEREWLKDLVVKDVEPLSPKLKAATVEYQGRTFLVVVGTARVAKMDYAMKPVDVNAGMFTAFVEEFDVPFRETTGPLEIIENALGQFVGSGDYAGHDLSLIAELFEPILAYEVALDSPIPAGDLTRLSCLWALKVRETIILPFTNETLGAFETLLSQGIQNLPSENLLRGLQCAHWQHAFLEIYRCIERLFSFQHIEELHKELAVAISLLEFAAKIEKATGWRPREEDAMVRLFDPMPPAAQALLETVRTELLGNTLQGLAGWLYSLRNSVVHFRPASERMHLTNSQWDRVMRATVLVIGRLYAKYDSALAAA